MLDIIKDYIDGKYVSSDFDNLQYLELIKKYDIQTIKDYYYEEYEYEEDEENINSSKNPDGFEIHIFPGKSNTYTIYEDDGLYQVRVGEYTTIEEDMTL